MYIHTNIHTHTNNTYIYTHVYTHITVYIKVLCVHVGVAKAMTVVYILYYCMKTPSSLIHTIIS